MDQVYEQIAPRRKGPKEITTQLMIYSFGSLAVAICCFLLLAFLQYATLFLFIMIGVIIGIFVLAGRQNVEFEYIFVGGTVHIDKVVNHKYRKRLTTFHCSSVRSITPYHANEPLPQGKQKHLCITGEDSFLVDSGKEYIIFSPNERMMGLIKDAIPRYMQNEVFKRH